MDISDNFPEADQPLNFHFKEIWKIIQGIFKDKRNEKKLILSFQQKLNAKGERLYGSLENGLWWEDKQVSLHSPPSFISFMI